MVPISILFVCAGNICRSPLAEGVMGHVLEKRGVRHVLVDSAGTNGYHTGQEPDGRSIRVAAQNGLDISAQRCRQLVAADFTRFDLILGMDHDNMRMIARRKPGNATSHIGLFTEVAEGSRLKSPIPFRRHRGFRACLPDGSGSFQRAGRPVLAGAGNGDQRPGFLDDIGSAAHRIA